MSTIGDARLVLTLTGPSVEPCDTPIEVGVVGETLVPRDALVNNDGLTDITNTLLVHCQIFQR